jgi:hypothetical protein
VRSRMVLYRSCGASRMISVATAPKFNLPIDAKLIDAVGPGARRAKAIPFTDPS